MDPYEKRDLLKKGEEGELTQEDIERFLKDDFKMPERYGQLESLAKKDADGQRIEAVYGGEFRAYWVPSDGAWMNARDFFIDKAYRIFGENDEKMELREVVDYSEINAIKKGYQDKIKSMVDKYNESVED